LRCVSTRPHPVNCAPPGAPTRRRVAGPRWERDRGARGGNGGQFARKVRTHSNGAGSMVASEWGAIPISAHSQRKPFVQRCVLMCAMTLCLRSAGQRCGRCMDGWASTHACACLCVIVLQLVASYPGCQPQSHALRSGRPWRVGATTPMHAVRGAGGLVFVPRVGICLAGLLRAMALNR